MDKMTKISVILPVYNTKEEFLREAIESILNQTYKDFEFIILNDGSTNNAKDVILSYNDKRIKYVEQENHGLIYTLNKGIALSQGEYIARMDSDDISLPERFAKQVEFLDNNPEIGIVGALIDIFPDVDFCKSYEKEPKFLDLLIENQLAHPVVMFRKSVLERFNLQYNNCLHAEDFELWSRMIKVTKFYNIQEVLLRYRFHGNNLSTVHQNVQIDNTNRIKQEMLDFLTNDKQLQKAICELICSKAQAKLNYTLLQRLFSIKNSPDKKYKYISILGLRIKLKRRNKKNKICYNQITLDDTLLLSELSKLGSFSYMPNSGNMGDMLIAEATLRWFDKTNLDWKRFEINEQPENFVYGGGGAWIAEWIDGLQHVMNIMKKAKRIVILPSSFNNVPEFIKILDERFVVFCREKQSYNYLIAQKTKAKILLDHDMAFRMSGELKTGSNPPTKKLKKLVKKLNNNIAGLPDEVCMFRKDEESAGHYKTDLDLSNALSWFSPYEANENINFAVSTMFEVLNRFQTIKTDRLHVGVAAALLGKKVYLYDNSYGKLSNVYNQSMKSLTNITLKQ